MKRIIIASVIAILSLGAVRPPRATDKDFVTLAWTHDDPAQSKFRVYQGRSPDNYDKFTEVTGPDRRADIELTEAGMWYFTATAVNDSGLESLPSNVVTLNVTPRPGAPTNLNGRRITVFVD